MSFVEPRRLSKQEARRGAQSWADRYQVPTIIYRIDGGWHYDEEDTGAPDGVEVAERIVPR